MPTTPGHLAALALSALAATALIVGTGRASLLLVSNYSAVHVTATAGGATDSQFDGAGGAPVNWQRTIAASAEEDDTHADAVAFMNTSWSPMGLIAAGNASGEGAGSKPWSVEGSAILSMSFVCVQCQEYELNTEISAGSSGASMPIVRLADDGLFAVTQAVLPGSTSGIGRLAPGTYHLFGRTNFLPISADVIAGLFSTNLTVTDCPSSLIAGGPSDVTVDVGVTVTLTVTPTPGPQKSTHSASGTPTFQWLKNHQNLTDGGRISGATTPTLVIANAAESDSGWYKVVVTDGSIVEPSRLARVTVNSTTDVDDPGVPTSAQLAVEALSPNPFGGDTRVRFTLPRDGDARVDVYDVTGRLVRTLLNDARVSAGPHTLVWDGRSDSGERTAVGAYLVRVRSGSESVTRRVVKISKGE